MNTEKGKRKVGFWKFAIAATALFVVFMFVKRNNVIQWIQAGAVLQQQEQIIQNYEKENAEMERQLDALTNNRDTLERYAREKFQFTKPGEDLYLDK